jgi:mono/diheme cytochrome c family protein
MLCTVAVGAAAQGGAARSVWNGVYTDAQAARGEKVAVQYCTRCHGQTLTGAEAAPGLVGDLFNANWEGVPLGDLFERIRVSMPQDAPGSLSRQQNTDVIAYLLKVGKFPTGEVELPTDTALLGQVTFVSNKP